LTKAQADAGELLDADGKCSRHLLGHEVAEGRQMSRRSTVLGRPGSPPGFRAPSPFSSTEAADRGAGLDELSDPAPPGLVQRLVEEIDGNICTG
jgi:hypothetical protein